MKATFRIVDIRGHHLSQKRFETFEEALKEAEKLIMAPDNNILSVAVLQGIDE